MYPLTEVYLIRTSSHLRQRGLALSPPLAMVTVFSVSHFLHFTKMSMPQSLDSAPKDSRHESIEAV
jgi:hypothetical protein